MGDGFRRLGERDVHQGHVWKVVVAQFEGPEGQHFARDIVRSPGAVAVVPLVFDAEGNPSVVLLRQWRPPYEAVIYEVPAGMRDVPGEPTEETARRELGEEAGLAPGRLDLLTEFYPSPGMTDSVCSVYLATGLQRRATSVARTGGGALDARPPAVRGRPGDDRSTVASSTPSR